MNPYYPHLFEPLTIKHTTFRNRLFVAPHMMSHMDFNGRPDESMIDFYAEKARGGYAVVTLGDTPVDREHAATNPRSFAVTPENQPKLAEIAREEHLAVGVRMTLSPEADIASEPRWGRVMETFGEDPDLVTQMVTAQVVAFQNGADGLNEGSIVACMKHFPGAGPQMDGKDTSPIVSSEDK